MKALSDDLRRRILDAVDKGEGSYRELALRFAVNLSTIVRLLQRRRLTGSAAPRPHGGGRRPTLDAAKLDRLRELVREDPDATLAQLRDRLGVDGSVMMIWRGLKALGITRKKKTIRAAERDRPDVQRKRRSFRRKVKAVPPRRLIFVDETGVTTAMTPAYARAPRGRRAVDSAPASWESTTLTVAIGLRGVRAPLVFPGATNEAAFRAYVEQVLAPTLRKGDVVVFDNLSAHLKPGVIDAIERADGIVLPLPPYSPDYTPIERMFSKLKALLRRAAARSTADLYEAIGEALDRVTVQDIRGWFTQTGLCATRS